MVFTLRHPELVQSLTLAEPGLDSLIIDPTERAAAATRIRDAYAKAAAIDREDDPVPALRTLVDTWFGVGWLDRQDVDIRRRLIANARTVPLASTPQPAVRCSDLRRLTLPVFLIQGELSDGDQRAIMDGLAECLHTSVRLQIRGAPHSMHRSHPTEFNAALLTFVESHSN